MIKICVVTATRSEYGLLKWIMRDMESCSNIELQVIVTGGHLLKEQGDTINQIKDDGFNISYVVDAGLDASSTVHIAESMGKMCQGFAKAFEFLLPDYVMVLGDRYELLPICSTALVMRIPIIHLCGGDVTEGAIDDSIRNAVTMMADYHFAGTRSSANNIIRMRKSDKNVWVVGEPGLDSFNRLSMLSRKELATILNLDIEKKWVLMTYHPETRESYEYNMDAVRHIIDSLLSEKDVQVIATYANADFGGKQINAILEDTGKHNDYYFKVVASLGQYKYLSLMKQVEFVIGNSSSGIVEAPFLGIPVINIGNRQNGRYLCSNVIQSDSDICSIKKNIEMITKSKERDYTDGNYWGDGNTSMRIIDIMCNELK